MAYAKSLVADCRVVEVRTLPDGRSDLFDRPELLVSYAYGASGNVYATLNRPAAGVRAGSTRALRDADIERVVRLPFDLDPVRAAGTASTDLEFAGAMALRDELLRHLGARGWPMPLVGDSGNGGHLVYRVWLGVDDEARQMVKAIYRGLAERFSTESVTFDRSVSNPARIWRLYDTTNRKGTATPERPHRKARCSMPANWQRVSQRQVEALANEFARRPGNVRNTNNPTSRPAVVGKGDYATLDVVAWFSDRGLYLRHLVERTHEVVCPWEGEHSSSSPADTVLFEATGAWPGFFCHHGHCAGRGIRDVMALWGDADRYCARTWTGGRHAA